MTLTHVEKKDIILANSDYYQDRLNFDSYKSEDGCRIDNGKIYKCNGYPCVSIPGGSRSRKTTMGNHLVAWVLKFKMAIPDKFYVKRKCGNFRCTNPDHFYLSRSSYTKIRKYTK